MARTHWMAPVVVAVLIALAGCSALPSVNDVSVPQASPQPGPTGTNSSSDSTPEPTTTTEPRINPWDEETLTVAVTAKLRDRNYTALAAPAIEYWNHQNDSARFQYAVPPTLIPVSNASSADIVLHYQPTITTCHGDFPSSEAGFFHCTAHVEPGENVTDQIVIEVTSRYANQTTTDLTVNALGGLYGLGASDTPRRIESPELLDPFPRADAVTVGIRYTADTNRNITPLVEQTVAYWMANDDAYGDYTTDWVVKPNATTPEVSVIFVNTVTNCGFGPDSDRTIGCTQLLSTDDTANTPVAVQIAAGFTDNSTLATLKHEFGHLYGLEHGEPPMPLMAASGSVVRLEEPDAADQTNPWRATPVQIYLDAESFAGSADEAREQFQRVLDYYATHAPPGFDLERTDSKATAEIVVEDVPAANSPCMGDHGSCRRLFGYSTDTDPALEYYSRLTIQLDLTHEAHIGWHVGYWIDTTITPEDSLDPWNNLERDDRANWWESE